MCAPDLSIIYFMITVLTVAESFYGVNFIVDVSLFPCFIVFLVDRPWNCWPPISNVFPFPNGLFIPETSYFFCFFFLPDLVAFFSAFFYILPFFLSLFLSFLPSFSIQTIYPTFVSSNN